MDVVDDRGGNGNTSHLCCAKLIRFDTFDGANRFTTLPTVEVQGLQVCPEWHDGQFGIALERKEKDGTLEMSLRTKFSFIRVSILKNQFQGRLFDGQ